MELKTAFDKPPGVDNGSQVLHLRGFEIRVYTWLPQGPVALAILNFQEKN
jgi:hypothetical protein